MRKNLLQTLERLDKIESDFGTFNTRNSNLSLVTCCCIKFERESTQLTRRKIFFPMYQLFVRVLNYFVTQRSMYESYLLRSRGTETKGWRVRDCVSCESVQRDTIVSSPLIPVKLRECDTNPAVGPIARSGRRGPRCRFFALLSYFKWDAKTS